MNNLPKILKPTDPVLFDLVIGEIQDILAARLLWLNHAFGKSQRMVKKQDRRTVRYPGIFVHGRKEDYVDVSPTQELGNFCFFIVSDPQTIEQQKNRFSSITSEVSAVFWFDLNTVDASNDRQLEAVKAQLIEVFTRNLFLKSGRFELTRIDEEERNIYNEYDLQEDRLQYLMHPYAALRVRGNLLIREGATC